MQNGTRLGTVMMRYRERSWARRVTRHAGAWRDADHDRRAARTPHWDRLCLDQPLHRRLRDEIAQREKPE
jgi:hypothetical protein